MKLTTPEGGSGVPPLNVQNPRRDASAPFIVSRYNRFEIERFESFEYEELLEGDKVNLEIAWLKEDSLDDNANLHDPDLLAREIVEALEVPLTPFRPNRESESSLRPGNEFAGNDRPR